MTEAGEAAVETGALPVEPTFARLLSTSLVFVLGAVASKVVGLVLLPILTRELTPAGYGETDVLLALSTALTAALTLGLDVVLLRLWFDQPDRRARRSLVSTAYASRSPPR